eukprot:Clim_evm94s128 gene=Clim_evmTU94s128
MLRHVASGALTRTGQANAVTAIRSTYGLYRFSVPVTGTRRPMSIFKQFVDNAKKGFEKNKEMQDKLNNLETEAGKLSESEALKKAKEFAQGAEGSAAKAGENFKKSFGDMADAIKNRLDTLQKEATEGMDKAKDAAKKAAEQAKASTSQASAKAGGESGSAGAGKGNHGGTEKEAGDQEAFSFLQDQLSYIRQELLDDAAARSAPYRGPRGASRRAQRAKQRKVEANEEATDVELHKESRFRMEWENFKENNPVFQRFYGLKMQFDESDHPVVRVARDVTDRFTEIFGGMFTQSEMKETLEEIARVEPKFNKEKFTREVESFIAPTVLEAYLRGDLDTLGEWSSEGFLNMVSAQVEQRVQQGVYVDAKILDLRGVDLAMAKVMDQGPCLIYTFNTQQITLIKDRTGEVKEGDPEKIEQCFYIMALVRDMAEHDPDAAWRVMEMGMQDSRQIV